MEITINGNTITTDCLSLLDLISAHCKTSRALVVELNSEVIPQSDWPGTIIRDNDRIELLNFVGGG